MPHSYNGLSTVVITVACLDLILDRFRGSIIDFCQGCQHVESGFACARIKRKFIGAHASCLRHSQRLAWDLHESISITKPPKSSAGRQTGNTTHQGMKRSRVDPPWANGRSEASIAKGTSSTVE